MTDMAAVFLRTDRLFIAMEAMRAMETIRSQCQHALGHLGKVVVTPHPGEPTIGVGLTLEDRTGGYFRHAVLGNAVNALEDPAEFADAVIDKILAWHRQRIVGKPYNEGRSDVI